MSLDQLKRYAVAGLLAGFSLLVPQFGISGLLPQLDSTDAGQRLPGKFIWFDLATSGLEEQKRFYGSVFGWTFRSIGQTDDQYTLIINGDRAVAGMFAVPPTGNAGAGALWIGLISTDDLGKTLAAVKQAGGAVHLPQTTVPKRGTFALAIDPEGALFGLLRSDSGDPPDERAAVGSFLWMDLFSEEPSEAGRFYQRLADYEINREAVKEGVDRLILSAFGKARAGIVPLPEEANRAGWLPYIRVDDVAEALARVEAAGGVVMVSPQADLLDGNLAIFADPEGGVMGVVKWDDPVAEQGSETP